MYGWRAGNDEIAHARNARRLQAAGEHVERGAGRHHIIDDEHMRPIQSLARDERAAQVAQALGTAQASLRRLLMTHTHHRIEQQWQTPSTCQRAGKFDTLVEAAFTQTLRMERHRQQRSHRKRPQLCQTARQERRHRQTLAILERLNQAIERKAVAECRPGGIESRRRRATLRTDAFFQGRDAALRTAARRRLRQTRRAGDTHRQGASGFTAQHTTTRQQGIEQAAPHI